MVGSEFVVLVFSPSVVRHVDINLARYATRGVVSSARTSARRSAKEGASDAPYRVGRVEYQKRFRTPWELTQEPSPGRANSLVHLRYPTAQIGPNVVRIAFFRSEQHAAFVRLSRLSAGVAAGHAGAARCQARWRLPGHLSLARLWRRLTLLQLLHMRCAAIACGA